MSSRRSPGRSLRVDGLVNARDLGGIERIKGPATPFGVFFRSEHLDLLEPAGWQQLYDLGVRTVIDLRRPDERPALPGPRPDWLTTSAVDLDGAENETFWADYWDNGLVGTALYYLPHLQAMPDRAGAALRAIVNAPPGGVLFHCAKGRDRTGLVALLLLVEVQARPDAIVDDYLDSVRRAGLLAAAGRPDVEAELESLCRSRGTTTEGAFRSALLGLDLDGLLDRTDLTEEERSQLRTWRGAIPPPTAR